MNKDQLVARHIKHLAECANFKGGTFNKQCNDFIRNCVEMPNVSYTQPLCLILKKKNIRVSIKITIFDTIK